MFMLLAPLQFLRIRYPNWLTYNVILPIVGASLLTWLLTEAGEPVPIFGKDHYLDQLQSLTVVLGGFFIAALTLVTTDSNPLLSKPVNGHSPPKLADEREPLTRRRWLAYLFGYLSFSSFMIVALVMVSNAAAISLKHSISPELIENTKIVFLMILNFWLFQIFVSSLIGLMYFTDRLHRDEPTLSTKDKIYQRPPLERTPAE